jgi:cytidine deaminase
MQVTESSKAERTRFLIGQARAASDRAYAPYSNARVGAAVSCSDGRVFAGCNVENASYGLTQCAERNAMNTAIAAGIAPRDMQEIAIFARGFEHLTPCGACRQVMIELLSADALVHCSNEAGAVRTWRLGELFPEPFVLE